MTILIDGPLLVAAGPGLARAVQVDAEIDACERSGGVAGTQNSIGSDRPHNLTTLWAEGFQELHSDVRVQIEDKG